MAWTGTAATGTMGTLSPRAFWLATLVLTATMLLLPWATGGRSPTGQALAVLLPIVGAGPVWLLGGGRLGWTSGTLLLGAVALAGASAAQTIYPDRTIQSLLLLTGYVMAGAAAAQCARALPRARQILLGAITLSGLAAGVAGLLRLRLGLQGGIYATELTGPFVYPNAMAGMLLLAAGAGATLAASLPRPRDRVLPLLAAAAMIGGLWLTGSRGAGIATGLGVLTYALGEALLRWRRPGLTLGLVTLGGGALAAAAGWLRVLPLPGWGAPAASVTDTSALWRLQILRWTWDMIREHPWLGVGPGGFPVALTHYQRIPYVSGENPHNLLAQIAAEFGLPAALLVLIALGILLGRMTSVLGRAEVDRRAARSVAVLLATLVALLVHSLLDMAWSFPAVAMGAAILCGLGAASLPCSLQAEPRRPLLLPLVIGLLLAAAAVLALTRYYASSLSESGRQALRFGAASLAIQDLTWALRLNPTSFPSHLWLAQAKLREGDPAGALAVAEGAARIAPADPNGAFLAGEIAAASGQWPRAEGWFQAAAARAPFAQLRFHAGGVEAAVRAGDASGATQRYERAVAAFSPERVLDAEARCLAPGDRYLLARMSRIVAGVYGAAGDDARRGQVERLALQLGQPDARGICATAEREGQTSPEAAMVSFWEALAKGGPRQAERYLLPPGHGDGAVPEIVWRQWLEKTHESAPTVSRVAALTGEEFQASLTVELLAHGASGQLSRRCVQGSLRMVNGGWFLEALPQVYPGPCTP